MASSGSFMPHWGGTPEEEILTGAMNDSQDGVGVRVVTPRHRR